MLDKQKAVNDMCVSLGKTELKVQSACAQVGKLIADIRTFQHDCEIHASTVCKPIDQVGQAASNIGAALCNLKECHDQLEALRCSCELPEPGPGPIAQGGGGGGK